MNTVFGKLNVTINRFTLFVDKYVLFARKNLRAHFRYKYEVR